MNITLIGMAGSGKSMIGAKLAKLLACNFIDIDKIIEAEKNKPIQSVLDELGDAGFINLEAEIVLALNAADSVISPGGSIIYSDRAMKYLKANSKIVFLDVQLEEIKKRVADAGTRGIVGLKHKTIDELYLERLPLYKKYADITVAPEENSTAEETAKVILKLCA